MNSPLISMLAHISSTTVSPPRIEFLYSVKQPPSPSKEPAKTLFLDRLQAIISKHPDRVNLELFVTGTTPSAEETETEEGIGLAGETGTKNPHQGRITQDDLLQALGTNDKSLLRKTTCYVCGPPQMTDEIVTLLEAQGARVYCEKWW